MRRYYAILILMSLPFALFAQKITKQQILQNVVNKWWEMSYGDGNFFFISDSTHIKKSSGGRGFALKKDGTFIIIIRSRCLQDASSPRIGKWRVSNDSVYFENTDYSQSMKIVSVDGSTLIIK
ncbi:MAG: hypothetical protein JST82_12820 [Bacteroidetes bacterium]|nr:hypothetical protein [Bacteroidota bacterium]